MQLRRLTIGLFIAVAVLGTQLSMSSFALSHRANGDTKFEVKRSNSFKGLLVLLAPAVL